ncbi:G-protein coupled receptor Mth2 isoform X2 [Musca domestica]|uniref:G-protein coupled receptor Mth2 isoform X2 n=1 Tax=Musca domestica TaxID=7370 RepID=A0ABM3V996_MUSDO|nr:G-protein coupled receptor Mth2 isoform X2 [Musca domestica]
MKHFSTIFVIFSIICLRFALCARDKCRADETLCVRSCCNSSDFYQVNVQKCELISKYCRLSTETKLNVFNGIRRYMNLLMKFWHDVSVPCLRSEDVDMPWRKSKTVEKYQDPINIPDYCFSAQYNSTTNQFDMVPLNCAKENTWHTYTRYVIIVGLLFSVLLLLTTICIYLTIRELRNNMRLKLFIWYLTSLVFGHTSLITCDEVIWNYEGKEYLKFGIGFISSYFFMSTFLSMNVIGFEIWITFKKVRVENNPHNDKKRYLIYAIYVWTVPIVFYLLYYLTLSSFWSSGPVALILLQNFITFIFLTYKICATRYKAATMRKDANLVTETIKIILSLFFMMGIPRSLFVVLLYLNNLAYFMISKYIFLSIEAPLIFKLFVLKKNVWNMLKNSFLQILAQICTSQHNNG